MYLVSLLASLHASSWQIASDCWPGWRGPGGHAVAEGSPPVEWSEEKNVRWKTSVPGKGLSSPVVWGGQIFVTTAVGTGKKAEPTAASAEREGGRPDGAPGEGRRGERGEGGAGGGERRGPPDGGRGGQGRGGRGAPIEEQDFFVLALDRATGTVKWQEKLATTMPHQGTHSDGSYASPTPVTDGERLYISFGSYGIYALSMAGELKWSIDLGDMDISNSFGEGSSPVLCGDLLIINWDHEGDSFLVALDKTSGKERWRTPRAGGTSWATPIVLTVGGTAQLVVGGTLTVAYDPATGKELWREGEAGRGGAIASPVVLDELVILANGGRGGGEARALVAQVPVEDEPVEALLWKQRVDAPHVPSPVALDGKVYLLKQDSGMLSVLDPSTGETLYGPERLKGVTDVYASLVAAGGRLYVAGRDGTVEVLSAWPKIETLSVNTLQDTFDSTPAIVGDELILRGRENVYCIAN